jgi:formate dehydrogenase major subunit
VPGLGASFGRGAATNYQQDLANSDCILFMGSNMAEAHPVGFRWPMRAREKGAHLIHVDPHFSRTSAMCQTYVGVRAGGDIAFLGGIVNYILTHDRWFKEFVQAYTNASTIINDDYLGPEELEGIFSGYKHEERAYHADKGGWSYAGSTASLKPDDGDHGDLAPPDQGTGGVGPAAAGGRSVPGEESGQGVHGYGLMGGASTHSNKAGETTNAPAGGHIEKDPTLQHPRCVFQLLKKHYARYTPEMVADICGCSPEELVKVAKALCDNSGRERTSMIVYALGWTQHSTGVQMIRTAGIIQQLLGNIGRPGGGIMAMRGHSSIQGSTDIPTLYDLLPGYLPQPSADKHHGTIDDYCDHEGQPTGYWANTKKFIVSLMKAYFGQAATPENDFAFKWLPRIDGDYSHLMFTQRMAEGNVKGFFLFGQNPAAGSMNAGLQRHALRQLDWLVVADWFETETAVFWKSDPKGPPADQVKTEVFFIPAASIAAKEGSFTNTQRLIQWHDKAVDPEGDCRSDAWFLYNLGKRLKQLYAGSDKPQDQYIKHLTWDYDFDEHPLLPDGTPSIIQGEPDMEKILQEINGYHVDVPDEKHPGKPKLLTGFAECKDDGSTAAGGWIYSGVFPEYGRNRARERHRTEGTHGIEPNWGYAWPLNRRVLYNRASADPEGKPWSERKKLIWWDAEAKKWAGPDIPDFEPTKDPSYRPPPDAKGMAAIAGNQPFIMHADGMAWLYSPGATKDGPFPAHYEPVESPVPNLLYPKQNDSPAVRYLEGPLNLLAHPPQSEYPIVACTYRLTEHYLSGPMSRFNSWLNELQPEMFVEMSPELAAERNIEHGSWTIIRSPRGSIYAKAMVTRRMKPLRVAGTTVHQVGLPFHWGFAGECVGGQANDLIPILADPNVSMHEAKVFCVQIEPSGPPPHGNVPTQKMAHWPTKDVTPETPRSGQPEGQMRPRALGSDA